MVLLDMTKIIEIDWTKTIPRSREGSGFPNRALENLYIWGLPCSPFNNHELAFAGDGLCESNLFDDIAEITVAFYGEDRGCYSRELWANPFRSEILRRLAGEEHCWYIGYRTNYLGFHDNVSKIWLGMNFFSSLMERNLSDLVFLDSGYHIGFGNGVVKKPVFEVQNHELDGFMDEVWPKVDYAAFSIEGYCMQPGKLELLREWNERERTPELFKEVINECFTLFYSSNYNHRFMQFITNKMDLDEFSRIIDFSDLQNQAKKL